MYTEIVDCIQQDEQWTRYMLVSNIFLWFTGARWKQRLLCIRAIDSKLSCAPTIAPSRPHCVSSHQDRKFAAMFSRSWLNRMRHILFRKASDFLFVLIITWKYDISTFPLKVGRKIESEHVPISRLTRGVQNSFWNQGESEIMVFTVS